MIGPPCASLAPIGDVEGHQQRRSAEASRLVLKVLMDLSEPEAGEDHEVFDPGAHFDASTLPVYRKFLYNS